MRSQLLTAITNAITTLTQFSVSQELPWEQNGQPLYLKNLKKIYVDEARVEQTTLIPTLNGDEVFQNDYIANVYLACDAKNQPTQLPSVVSAILGSKSAIAVVNFGVESDYTVERLNDVLLYTFEFRLNQATT